MTSDPVLRPRFHHAPAFLVSDVACRDHLADHACRYQVAWKINPHMEIGAVDFAQAAAQHAALMTALEQAGAQVVRVPFVHGAYDSVFAKDSALVLERGGSHRVLLARPRHPEREREQAARADVYERHGYEVVREPGGATWEGGDVVVLPSGRAMFLGHGERSRRAVASWIERHAEVPVTPLELTDPEFFHLDMALTVLPDGTALVCEGALNAGAMHTLERAHGIRQVISIPRAAVLGFGLNVIAVGATIISGAPVRRVQQLVEARGFRYQVIPLDQFHLAGGSAACLVSAIHPEPAPQPARATSQASAIDLYGPVFRSVIFPLWESRIRRRPVVDRWVQLEASQWQSLDQLHDRQARALRRLLAHAHANVPFYRERFAAAGVAPCDIESISDLARLPILRRAELRRANRESMAPPLVEIRKQTSGTTGEPLVFGYEVDSEHWRRAVKYRGYAWAGYRPGDRALHFWGAPDPTPPRWSRRLKIALDRRLHRDSYMYCAVMDDEHLREVVRVIQREAPQVLVCYAQAGAELARYINRNGLRSWRTMPVLCGAERLLPHDRADLIEAFGPSVFDTYGCREVMMIAAECEVHEGMHVAVENLVVEIIVTENGIERPARDGEAGEVVITDLHNLAMPFIRYANGDVAVAGPSRRCACGRTLPRIQSVQGRISEMLHDANDAPVSGIAISFLVQDLGESVRRFQAVQHRDRSVTIKLVLSGDLPAEKLDTVRKNGKRLLSGTDVSVAVVPELPRSTAGKHQLVVVEH